MMRSLAEAVRRTVRAVRYPFPPFPYLACHVLCPTDAEAERRGVPCTEAVFAARSARVVVAALAAYLGDAEAERALKKDFHRIYEERLRAVALAADPTEAHAMDPLRAGALSSPLDACAAADLGVPVAVETGVGTVLRHWLSLLATGLAFLGTAMGLLVRFGRLRVDPVACRVASPNFWDVKYWAMLRDAARDGGLWRDGDLLFVLTDPAAAKRFVGGPFPTLDPARLPVPVGGWLTRVVLPGLALVPRVLWAALRNGGDPRQLEVAARALHIAAGSLAVWRLGFNLRCRWLLDTEHNSSAHIVRGIVLRKFGGGVVRWLYSQNESPGVYLSYLGYDLYLSAGPFQHQHYRATWYPRMVHASVGQIRNDFRLNEDGNVEPAIREAIEGRLARGEKMAVYFGGNVGIGFDRPQLDSLAALVERVAARPGWFLVIKPKGREGLYDLCRRDPRLAALHDTGNILPIHYPVDLREVCPAGWLIERMNFGLTLPGSVQFEALTGGKPVLAYWPIVQDTPARRVMRDSGLLYEDFAALERGLEQLLDDPASLAYPVDWVRESFDPFADDRALERVAQALFARGDGPRQAGLSPTTLELSAP